MRNLLKFNENKDYLIGVDDLYWIVYPSKCDEELDRDYIDLEYDKWLKLHNLISWNTGNTNPYDYLPYPVQNGTQVRVLHGSPSSKMYKSRKAWIQKWKEDPVKGPFCFSIFEMDDDFYIIELKYDSFPLAGFGNSIFYKCDQWDGLMRFLKDFEMIKSKYIK